MSECINCDKLEYELTRQKQEVYKLKELVVKLTDELNECRQKVIDESKAKSSAIKNVIELTKRLEEYINQKSDDEIISDWIAQISQNDNGRVFMKDVKDGERAWVTYGDLRILICDENKLGMPRIL